MNTQVVFTVREANFIVPSVVESMNPWMLCQLKWEVRSRIKSCRYKLNHMLSLEC
jgi:hypothetical protein